MQNHFMSIHHDCALGWRYTQAQRRWQVARNFLGRLPDHRGDHGGKSVNSGYKQEAFDYLKAQRMRQGMQQAWSSTISDADVIILTPALITEPPCHNISAVEIEDRTFPLHTAMTRCTMPFNLTGMPVMTLPVRRTGEGWPVSIQLAAAS